MAVVDGEGLGKMFTKTPRTQSDDRLLTQTSIAVNQRLDSIISSQIVRGLILSNVALINGTTTINHTLGRILVGWFIIGNNAAVTVHDTQASNTTPAVTLVLVSNGAAIVTLFVF